MEFDTEAVFDAVVAPDSLRDVRRTVENELDDLEVQLDAQVSAGGGSGGDLAARDRAMSRNLQTQQIDALSDIQSTLDDQRAPEQVLDEWDFEHELSQVRNDLLRELLEEQSTERFDNAIRGGMGGGLLGMMLGAGIAGVGSALSGLGDFKLEPPDDLPLLPVPPALDPVDIDVPSLLDPVDVDVPSALDPVDVDVPGALDPVEVPNPEWLPIDIPLPDWAPLPVESPTTSPGAEPSPITIPDSLPEDSITRTRPDPTGSPVSAPTPSDDPSGTGGGVGVPEIVGGGLAGAGAGYLIKELSDGLLSGGATAGAPIALPSIIAGQVGRRAENTPDDKQNPLERIIDDLIPDVNNPQMAMQSNTPTATSTASMGRASPGNSARTERPVEVKHSPTFQVRDLSELKRKQEQSYRELERRVQDLEQAFR